jgi:hypothetical protein
MRFLAARLDEHCCMRVCRMRQAKLWRVCSEPILQTCSLCWNLAYTEMLWEEILFIYFFNLTLFVCWKYCSNSDENRAASMGKKQWRLRWAGPEGPVEGGRRREAAVFGEVMRGARRDRGAVGISLVATATVARNGRPRGSHPPQGEWSERRSRQGAPAAWKPGAKGLL